MNHPPPSSLLIVEDLPETLTWLSAAALAAFPEARQYLAGNAAEARRAFAQQPSLALLDLGLPDEPGLAVLRDLRRALPQCLCVITTIFDDDGHLFSALQLGASGYVLKDQSREQLSQMLRDLLTGQPPLSPSVARRLLSHFQPPRLPPEPAREPLSGREREVLQLVAKGYSVPEAARALSLSPNTAHTYIKNVYRKLEVSSRAEAVLAASRMGLV